MLRASCEWEASELPNLRLHSIQSHGKRYSLYPSGIVAIVGLPFAMLHQLSSPQEYQLRRLRSGLRAQDDYRTDCSCLSIRLRYRFRTAGLARYRCGHLQSQPLISRASIPTTATPNHALQRTGSAVTAPAADHHRLSTHRQVPRPLRLSLSLGSLGDSHALSHA